MLKSIRLFYPVKNWDMGFTPKLNYVFKSRNALSISYNYSFYRIIDSENVYSSKGKWLLGITTVL